MEVRQISVFLENRQGRLAEVLGTLAREGVNIRALSLADTSDFGILRLIVPEPGKALRALEQKGFTVAETVVIAVAVPDRSGGLARIVDLLSGAGINLEYLYAFVEKQGAEAIVILRVENTPEAGKILGDAGVRLLGEEEVGRL